MHGADLLPPCCDTATQANLIPVLIISLVVFVVYCMPCNALGDRMGESWRAGAWVRGGGKGRGRDEGEGMAAKHWTAAAAADDGM